MKTRTQTPVRLALVAMLFAPVTLSAQNMPQSEQVAVGVFVGSGSTSEHRNPAGALLIGLDAGLQFSPALSVHAEYAYFGPGSQSGCILIDEICAATGTALLAGLRLRVPAQWRIKPHVQVSAGSFAFDEFLGFSSLAAGVRAGARIRVVGPLAASLNVRYLRAFDDEYEAVADRPLEFVVGSLGLEYAIAR